MKKFLAFCLAAVMLLSLAACGQDNLMGDPDIAPEDDPGAKSGQQIAEQGQVNLSEGDGKTDTHDGLDTADWKAEIDKGPYMESHRDIAPEDDPNAGGNQQAVQHFVVDLPSDDGSGLENMTDTASYAGAAAETKIQ
jgi:predicted small lipoprotein YifL